MALAIYLYFQDVFASEIFQNILKKFYRIAFVFVFVLFFLEFRIKIDFSVVINVLVFSCVEFDVFIYDTFLIFLLFFYYCHYVGFHVFFEISYFDECWFSSSPLFLCFSFVFCVFCPSIFWFKFFRFFTTKKREIFEKLIKRWAICLSFLYTWHSNYKNV